MTILSMFYGIIVRMDAEGGGQHNLSSPTRRFQRSRGRG